MLLTSMEEIKLRRIPSIICKGYSGDDRADQTEFTFDLPFNNGNHIFLNLVDMEKRDPIDMRIQGLGFEYVSLALLMVNKPIQMIQIFFTTTFLAEGILYLCKLTYYNWVRRT